VETDKTLTVKIPAGVDDGSRIRLSGSGEAGVRNGPDGDLYVYLSVRKHDTFRRDGLNVFADVPISFPTAALGGEIRVTALDGEHTLNVPAGTQTGASFRMRGHGMPAVRGGVRGDHLVTVRVVVPTKLGKREKELLEAYAAANADDDGDRTFFDRVKEAFKAE
jgi:molecular chaperone DnaJ